MVEVLLSTLADALGGPVVADATFTATATRARAVGDGVVANKTITVSVVQGVPSEPILLDHSGVDWCWRLRVVFPSIGVRIDRTVAVPDVPSVEWADLVDVDPATLLPAESAVPAWTAAVGQVAAILADTAVARDGAVTAQGLSEAARDAAVLARGISEIARDGAVVAQGASEEARDQAQVYAANTVELQDTTFTALIADPESATRTQLNATIVDEIESNDTMDFLGLVMAPISPARYGASMTGQNANDGPAIQAAINAAQDRGYRGGAVKLGHHRSTQQITVSSENITIEGQGGTLRGGGLKIARGSGQTADLYTRVEDLNIDMEDPANGNAVTLERVGRIQFKGCRIFNADSGFFVPNHNEHQHVRRVFLAETEVMGCNYGWFSVQPEANNLRYTVGDIQISNAHWYNNKVVMRAAGLDGLNVTNFKSFQRQRSDRQRAFDLEYINFANFAAVNIFEPGHEGLRISRFQNFHWDGGNVAWAGQLVPSSGILMEGGDLSSTPGGYALSSIDNVTIQKATKHGLEIASPVDRVVIGEGVIVQGSGDDEFYFGDVEDLAAITTNYGFMTPSSAGQIRALGTSIDRANAYAHTGGETRSIDSLRMRKLIKTRNLTGTETSIDGAQGYDRVVCSQSAPSTITLISAGQNGDELTICGVNGNTTIAHGGSGGATVRLKGATNATIPANGILTLYYTNSSWTEKSRSW